jgi:signal transduction histidine kinase
MPFPVQGVSMTLAAHVLDSLPDQLAVVDDAGTILAVNAAWDEFARENGGEADRVGVGVNYVDVCRRARGRNAAEGQAVADGLSAVLAGDTPSFALDYPCHAPGEERWFLLTARPLPPPDGGALVMHTAVTVQKQAAVLEQFLGESFAHQLRNPLTRVELSAQLLQRQLDRRGVLSGDRLRAALADMRAATAQMTDLLSAVQRGLALPALTDIALERRPINLVELVEERVTVLRRRTPSPTLTLDSAEANLVGHWDSARLGRALDHLLDNAVAYSRPDSPVSVALERAVDTASPWAVVGVRDAGIGIPADDLPHVFARFYRGRNAISYAPGTGLGLTEARQLIALHGGSLALASREGEGTTATVRLPLHGGAAA